MLTGKNIIFGVTGGIAVYKAVEIISLLKKRGANVHVIMTRSATEFVTPLTFREISGNPVISDMWDEPKQWKVAHIALATLADIMVIAPATANVIGKVAHGIADDMLTTTIMATTAPVLIAPAMNSNMYRNPIVQANINKLTTLGYHFVPPEVGMLACGVADIGRLAEPNKIVATILELMLSGSNLAGKKVLVTAGGTREAIDPVRYIGNRSSGKMGFAIAQQAAQSGAQVVLVSGSVSLETPPGVTRIDVESASAMRNAVLAEYTDADIVIKAAAVADYRPLQAEQQKIKKSHDNKRLLLELVENPDILAELGKCKQHQILIGFAAETHDLLVHATDKLRRKNLDMIVANDVTLPNAGFNAETNVVKLLFASGEVEELPLMSKHEVARIILERASSLLQARQFSPEK